MTAHIDTTTGIAARPARAVPVTPFLRLALRADALASGAVGLVLAAAAGPLAGLLGLPDLFLRVVGVVLIAWAGGLWFASARRTIAAAPVWTIIAVNAIWAVDSVVLLASGLFAPTGLGTAFVLVQAALVVGFTAAQILALRRARATPIG